MPLLTSKIKNQGMKPTSTDFVGSIRKKYELLDIASSFAIKSEPGMSSELEGIRVSNIKAQNVSDLSNVQVEKSRFPKLEDCAHFHYDHVEIGSFQVTIIDDDDLKTFCKESDKKKWWSLSVKSQNVSWLIKRSYNNFKMLDRQLHRCIYDRKFSELTELPEECIEEQENIHKLLSDYVKRFSEIAGNLINCGPILNWLELDNKGHRLLVPNNINYPINTPAVAAAYATRRYSAQAPDEISFEVGDIISVIDMPPSDESIWWRGKRGFQVGFFPCGFVAVIGDKIPKHITFSSQISQPIKPVLRKHGKLIAFFRSFILSRPSRRRLKQSGILKERVFGCDLGEHLLNSGHEIPVVLKCCIEFIETHGMVDGIYRLSGITSNIQKLRNTFDEDRIPALYEDQAILQDVHSVASLLKMYFRELPNPLCTYQLYYQFVQAVQASDEDSTKLLKIKDVVQQLPPPHYRTLKYLMKHLARVSEKGCDTGMTSRNIAIVWAPNLLRCKELEVGGVAALQGVGVQAIVTEFIVCYADMIFSDKTPDFKPSTQSNNKKYRPKSLAISTPTKLLSLEEARTRVLSQSSRKIEQNYIEVGGGPGNIPIKYHTVIELPNYSRKRLGSKRSPIGWKFLFGKYNRNSQTAKEGDCKTIVNPSQNKVLLESSLVENSPPIRSAKSVESLSTSQNSLTEGYTVPLRKRVELLENTSTSILLKSFGGKNSRHSRSVSHESYFDRFQNQKRNLLLDLSEIHLNFDLEESEMRIFSEDETLMSGKSESLASDSSSLISNHKTGTKTVSSIKRLSTPKSAPVENFQSSDPSPKKQKTNDENSSKSKLEEQLLYSIGEIEFIDCVSPDQSMTQSDINLIQSPASVTSISKMGSIILSPSSSASSHISHSNKSLPVIPKINNENNNLNAKKLCKITSEKSVDIFERDCSFKFNSDCSNNYYCQSHLSKNNKFSETSTSSSGSCEEISPETPISAPYRPLVNFEESFSITDSICNIDETDLNDRNSSIENLNNKTRDVCLEIINSKSTKQETLNLEEKKTSDIDCESSKNFEKCIIAEQDGAMQLEKSHNSNKKVNITVSSIESERDVLPNNCCNINWPAHVENFCDITKYERISTESSCDSLINNSPAPYVQNNEENTSPLSLNYDCEKQCKRDDNILEKEQPDVFEYMLNSMVDEKQSNGYKRNYPHFGLTEYFSPSYSLGKNESNEITEAKSSGENFSLLEENKPLEKDHVSEQKSKCVLETDLDAFENVLTLPKAFLLRSTAEENKSLLPLTSKRLLTSENVKQKFLTCEDNVTKSNFNSDSRDSMQEKGVRPITRLNSARQYLKPANENDSRGRAKTLDRLFVKRKTEKHELNCVALGKSKSGSQINEERSDCDKLKRFFTCEFDTSDPQRRERIEKYKEKRRNYLREKYKSESFKSEKSDSFLSNKHRSFFKSEVEGISNVSNVSRLEKDKFSNFLRDKVRNENKIVLEDLGEQEKINETPASKDQNQNSFSDELSEHSTLIMPKKSGSLKDNPKNKNKLSRLSYDRNSFNNVESITSLNKKSHTIPDLKSESVKDSRARSAEKKEPISRVSSNCSNVSPSKRKASPKTSHSELNSSKSENENFLRKPLPNDESYQNKVQNNLTLPKQYLSSV